MYAYIQLRTLTLTKVVQSNSVVLTVLSWKPGSSPLSSPIGAWDGVALQSMHVWTLQWLRRCWPTLVWRDTRVDLPPDPGSGEPYRRWNEPLDPPVPPRPQPSAGHE